MKWFLPFGIFLLVSCQSTSGSFCDIASPIRLSEQSIDQLTDREVADILRVNERGSKICGWQP